jgi:PAS domain S-box-containing protein
MEHPDKKRATASAAAGGGKPEATRGFCPGGEGLQGGPLLREGHFNLAFASSGMGTFDWDISNDVRHFDEAFMHLAGLDPLRFSGSAEEFYSMIHPADRDYVRDSLARALQRGIYETEFRSVWPDGSLHHIAAQGKVTLDAQGQPSRLNGVAWDITQRKLDEEERRRFDERLNRTRALEALGVLVAGVAHNMNNVLAVIMGTASLRERAGAEGPDLEAYQTIGKVCRRGRDVVRSLIQFSRPTLSGQVPLALHPLVQEVAVLLENTTRNRVRIETVLAEEPLWIHGDAGSFNLALVNLCFNALEAMPEGGTLTLRTATAGADGVEVSVEDTGCGMDEDIMKHMLEPFFTTKDSSSGAGLGLSMVYGVIKAHGGTIAFTSRQGQGTEATIRLPRIPAPDRGAKAGGPERPHRVSRVLLVDDDEDVRFLMVRMLRKAGVDHVEAVESGAAALASLGSGELPDLVILDQNMPGMTGTQAMELIRERHPDLAILFSSGQPDLETCACLRQPRVGVISKPFTMAEIQARLEAFQSLGGVEDAPGLR